MTNEKWETIKDGLTAAALAIIIYAMFWVGYIFDL